jgi:ABC-type branched-subunit amino acid transport system permease subunit
MFETFAVLSTLSCLVIFALLVQRDRAGRREDAARDDESSAR